MIIAHIPAGYLFSKLMYPSFRSFVNSPGSFVTAGVIGAVAPDLDMFHFYLVDHRQHHHHTYWPHFPIIWLGLLGASALWLRLGRRTKPAALAVIFSLNGVLHVLLDTVASDVWWFAPFSDHSIRLINVPLLRNPWWLNFLVHWTFAIELLIVGMAVIVWCRTRNSVPSQ